MKLRYVGRTVYNFMQISEENYYLPAHNLIFADPH